MERFGGRAWGGGKAWEGEKDVFGDEIESAGGTGKVCESYSRWRHCCGCGLVDFESSSEVWLSFFGRKVVR